MDWSPPVQTSYTSVPVDLPASFLCTPPIADADADPQHLPVTYQRIDWAKTPLPQNGTRYAVVLDNVLNPAECAALLRFAEASVAPANRGDDGDPWQPAMVNVGPGLEVRATEYRNSDRIIWDHQELVDRLWARCLQAPGLREQLAAIQGDVDVLGPPASRGRDKGMRRWEFRRLNQRMRFLRYGPGQYFRPHADGPYTEQREDGRIFRTLFTVHLYLNDSKIEAGEADLVGGATSFLSDDESTKVDVNPKAGRVLIFQHRRLYHAGDDVFEGRKYTMRTDILYERVADI